jgi:hypothetical protein
MNFPVILAHGALGPWDEIILIGVAIVFLIMMGISFVKNRNAAPEDVDAVPIQDTPDTVDATGTPDHIRLD